MRASWACSSRGTHHLLQAQRKGAARFGADERQAEEGNAGHRFLQDAREEAVETEGPLAGFGDDDLIASQDVDVVILEVMLLKDEPEEVCPGKDSSKEALDSAVPGAIATPARDAGHGDAASHGQERQGDEVEVAQRGWAQAGVETLEQC
jgi:hypothetical protein